MRTNRLIRILPWIFLLYTLHITLYTSEALCASKGNPPVAYWRFDEGGGGTGYDSAGSNNGALNAGAGGTNTAVGQMWTRQGKIGGALECDGTDDYVSVSDSASLKPINAVTLEAWIKPVTPLSNYQMIIDKQTNTGSPAYTLRLDSTTGKILFRTSGTSVTDLLGTTVLSANIWYYVVGVYDGATSKIYINGVLDNSQSNTGSITYDTTPLSIGRRVDGYYFNGLIDDVRIYNYARTADQIMVDYNAGVAAYLGAGTDPNEGNPPVGCWTLDENTGTTAYDRSGNGINGTITDATWAQGKYGSALSFDGNGDYVTLNSASILGADTSITVEAWVKPNSISGSQCIIGEFTGDGKTRNYFTLSGGKILFDQYDPTGNPMGSGNVTLSTNAWHHVAVVRNDSSLTFYVDGVIDKTGTAETYTGGMPTTVIIGKRPWAGSEAYFNGLIDEIKVYDYVRSSGQIAYDYNKGKPVAHYKFDEGGGAISHNEYSSADTGTAPVGWWRMDEANWNGTANEVVDSSGNANHAAAAGGVTKATTTSSSKIGPYAGSFDGVDDYVTRSTSANLQNNYFTIEAWVYNTRSTPQTGYGDTVFHLDDTSGGNVIVARFSPQAGTQTSNKIEFWWAGGTSSHVLTTAYSSSTWYHLAYVKDSAGAKIYVNGANVLSEADNTTVNYTNARNISIGQDQDGGSPSDFFQGRIDDVRVYNYARTAEQIYNDYKTTHGTLVGDTKFVDGKIGKALTFDGTGDYVDCGSDASVNISDAVTVEAWFKASALNRYQRIVSKQYQTDVTTANSCYQLGVDNVNKFRWSIGGQFDYSLSSPLVSQDTWYHFAGTYDRTYAKMYINGQELWSSTSYTGAIRSNVNEPLTIGISKFGGSIDYSWLGLIDDVRIYNYTRTADQIMQDYNAGMSSHTGTSTGVADPWAGALPVGHWKLDENTGVLANDASGNGNNGTLTNGPAWTQGKVGPCLSFDGTDDCVTTNLDVQPSTMASTTWEAWVYPTRVNHGSRQQIFGGDDGGYDRCLLIESSTSNFGVFNGGGVWQPAGVTLNNWQHIAVVFTVSNIEFYKNGIRYSMGSAPSGQASVNKLNIGRNPLSGGSEYFQGKIDDAKVYNYARTQAQIAWDYNKGKPAGYWRFDESSGATCYDDSGNGNSGTATIGGTGTQTTIAAARTNGATGKYGHCMSFDGTDDVVTVANFGTKIPAQEITVAAWIKPGVASGNDDLICTDPFEPGGGSNRFNIHFPWDTTIIWQFGKPFTGTSVALDPSWVGVWGHYTFVASVSGNFYKIYRNGVQVATAGGVTAYDPSTQATLRIGGRAGNPFQGMIDDLRIYNYARTADQVMQDYNQGLAAKMGE